MTSRSIPTMLSEAQHLAHQAGSCLSLRMASATEPPAGYLVRTGLLARLDSCGPCCRLLLVTAPAGYGKSTLLRTWAAQSPRAVAWLGLQPEDNALHVFLVHLQAALGAIWPAVYSLPLSAPTPEAALRPLINMLAATPQTITLVLDGYEAIQAGPVHRAMAFLLEYLPPTLQVVLSSRSEPPLPLLPRLRVRAHLHELHTDELRLTTDEALLFLADRGAPLTLAERAAGWVTGLALLAQAWTAGQPSTAQALPATLADYFTHEVFAPQPLPIRRFLVQTAGLAQLTGPACDALTGRHDSWLLLEALERAGLFLAPVNERRTAYRYHPLFAEFLQTTATTL